MINIGLEFETPTAFDPFADAKDADAFEAEEYVHIQVRQRNGRKCLTTIEGLHKDLNYEKKVQDLKKALCCNGNLVQDKDIGKIRVFDFLVQPKIADKDHIKMHGF